MQENLCRRKNRRTNWIGLTLTILLFLGSARVAVGGIPPELLILGLTPPEEMKLEQVTPETAETVTADTIEVGPNDLDEFSPSWEELDPDLLTRTRVLAERMKHEGQEKREALGEAAFRTELNANRIFLEVQGLGKAEINWIDGKYFVRVVDYKTGVAVLYFPNGVITPGTFHYRQYLARQHTKAGDPDKKGAKHGRDVIISWVDDHFQVVRNEYLPRPRLFSEQFFKEWWYKNYVPSTKGTRNLAILCVVLQSGVAAIMAGSKYGSGLDKTFDWPAVILPALYTYAITNWNSTYRNIANEGTERQKFYKKWLQRLSFAYLYTGFRKTGLNIVNLLDVDMIAENVRVFIQTGLQNMAGRPWDRITDIQKRARKDEGTKKLRFFGREYDTEVSAVTFDSQFRYMIPFSFKLLSLTGLAAFTYRVPVIGLKLDPAMVPLFLSAPIVAWIAVKYAYKMHDPEAHVIETEFKNAWYVKGIRRLFRMFGLARGEEPAYSEKELHAEAACGEKILEEAEAKADHPAPELPQEQLDKDLEDSGVFFPGN